MEDILKNKIFEKYPAFKSHIKKIIFKTSTEYFDIEKEAMVKRAEFHSSADKPKKSFQGKLHPHNPEYKKLYLEYKEEYNYITDEEVRENLISIAIQRKLLKQGK
jgi:hypothetical protein